MFTGGMIGFLVGISAATWVYSKMMRSSGGNTQSSLIVAAIVGLISFLVIMTVVSLIDKSLAK
jgi:hypothetical protein